MDWCWEKQHNMAIKTDRMDESRACEMIQSNHRCITWQPSSPETWTVAFDEKHAKSSSRWYDMSRMNNVIPQCVKQIEQFLQSPSGPRPSGWMPNGLFNIIWSQVKQSGGAAHLHNQPVGHIRALCNSAKWVEWASLYFHWPQYIIVGAAAWLYSLWKGSIW